MTPGRDADDPEQADPGLARERTSLAWTRTAIAFGAVGAAELKANLVAGLIIAAIAPLVWGLGRLPASGAAQAGSLVARHARHARLRLITISIAGVSLLCLLIALFGPVAPSSPR